ncbi:hypothetical protein MW887_007615 [Aspergillus wentii]|nr:hypothetical protein MW887_007615 [Aspergillus wentii]
MRLQQDCKYVGSTPPGSTRDLSEPKPGLAAGLAPQDVKADIENNLSGFSPAEIAANYLSQLHPWFPIVSESKISNGISTTWKDATVERTLLYFTMLLLISEPEGEQDNEILSPKLQLAYLFCKRWTVLLEAAGSNSLDLIRSRLVLTLFEVGHGLYPAAHISFGAVLGAVEAFNDHSEYNASITSSSDEGIEEEYVVTSALAIIDRFMTAEKKQGPSLTRGKALFCRLSPVYPHSTIARSSSNQAFSRLFEASSLMEKVQIALNEPTRRQSFNIEEMTVIVQTLKSFEAVLLQEIPEKGALYSGALVLCEIGLVHAYDAGTKVDPSDVDTTHCRAGARNALDRLLEAKLTMAQPYLEGDEDIDFKILPPFLTYLVYKCAATVTERLRVGDESLFNFKVLKCLRDFLALLSQRWLAGRRYLRLLDEDTTPRMMKSIQ